MEKFLLTKNKNKGFVLLFAIVIASIVAAVALGIASIVFKELGFTTSAKNSNEAFFAADVGAECALYQDRPPTHFPIAGPASTFSCSSNSNIVPIFSTSGGNGLYEFEITSLGNSNQSCAKVSVQKQSTGNTVITSRGYNVGDASCESSNPNRVERKVVLNFAEDPAPQFLVDTNGNLPDNLVAYWKLNEASGFRIDAYSAAFLTDNNTVTSVAGKRGNAARFTMANSEYLSIADNPAVSVGGTSYTIAGWVYMSTGTNWGTLISKYSSATNREYWVGFDPTTPRFYYATYNSAGAQVGTVTSGSVSTGNWYFLIMEYNLSNNQISISVNNGTPNTSTASAAPADTTSILRLGADSSSTDYLDGYLDEWGMWKRLLTSQEKANLYNAGAGNTYAP